MASYCDIAPGHPIHAPYHQLEYGFPASDDHILFERLVLEINQAGLSWLTILKKRASFRLAYSYFDIDAVAKYDENDRVRLLSDTSIIRNRLKVEASIENARKIQFLKNNFGSFNAWLDSHHPLLKKDWVQLFRTTFKFTGPQITNEFLMSLGYLPGAHDELCPIQSKIKKLKPPWMQVSESFWLYD